MLYQSRFPVQCKRKIKRKREKERKKQKNKMNQYQERVDTE